MQRRSFQWKDDDYTDAINRHQLGIIPYGLYCGFDAVLDATLLLKLNHLTTGLTEVNDELVRTPKLGKIITQQGVVIIEDALLNVVIEANATSFPRIDTIIVEHTYVKTVGGAPAVYKVVKGSAAANPVPAAIPFPDKQIAIGYLTVPAAATNLSGATYIRPNVPTLGNDATIMRTNVEQTSTARKQLHSVYGRFNAMTVNASTKTLTGSVEGNFYKLDNVSDDYIEVHTLTVPFNAGGYVIDILCLQDLKIKTPDMDEFGAATGNLIVGEADNGVNGYMYVKEGEIIRLVDVTGSYYKGNFDVPMYVVSKAGYANKTVKNKFVAEQVMGKGTATAVSSAITLDGKGNFYIIPLTSGNDLRYLPSRQTGYTGKENAGGVLFVTISLSGSSPTFLKHQFTPNITGNKTFRVFNNADVRLYDGDMLVLVEDEAQWVVASIIGLNTNVINVASSLASFITATNANFTAVNLAITNLNTALTTGLADVNTRIDELSLDILDQARAYVIANALEPNIMLKGGLVSSVTGDFTSGTLVISAGTAQIGNDILAVPAYTGTYPIYLEKDPAAPAIAPAGRWVVGPVSPAAAIKYDPYTSQYLKDVHKRAAYDIGDIRHASILGIDFDSSGAGRWSQKGFKLLNGLNGTTSAVGKALVGYNDQPVIDFSNPEYEYRSMWNTLGTKFYTLTLSQIPAHHHSVPYTAIGSNAYGGGSNVGNRSYDGGSQTTYANSNTSDSGSNESHENRGPRLTVAMMIRYDAP